MQVKAALTPLHYQQGCGGCDSFTFLHYFFIAYQKANKKVPAYSSHHSYNQQLIHVTADLYCGSGAKGERYERTLRSVRHHRHAARRLGPGVRYERRHQTVLRKALAWALFPGFCASAHKGHDKAEAEGGLAGGDKKMGSEGMWLCCVMLLCVGSQLSHHTGNCPNARRGNCRMCDRYCDEGAKAKLCEVRTGLCRYLAHQLACHAWRETYVLLKRGCSFAPPDLCQGFVQGGAKLRRVGCISGRAKKTLL